MSFTICTNDRFVVNTRRDILDAIPGWETIPKSIQTLFHVNVSKDQFIFLEDFYRLTIVYGYKISPTCVIQVTDDESKHWKFDIHGEEISMQKKYPYLLFFNLYLVRQELNWPVLTYFLTRQIGVIKPWHLTYSQCYQSICDELSGITGPECNEVNIQLLRMLCQAGQDLVFKYNHDRIIYYNIDTGSLVYRHHPFNPPDSLKNTTPLTQKTSAAAAKKRNSKVAPEEEVNNKDSAENNA